MHEVVWSLADGGQSLDAKELHTLVNKGSSGSHEAHWHPFSFHAYTLAHGHKMSNTFAYFFLNPEDVAKHLRACDCVLASKA